MIGNVKFVCRECFRKVYTEANSRDGKVRLTCPNCESVYKIQLHLEPANQADLAP